jgi:hypothetical protein
MDGNIVGTDQIVKDGSNARSWQEHRDRINRVWSKGAAAYIETGKFLLDAKAELERDAFAALTQFQLHFEASVSRKLMRIASTPLLCAHVHKLPNSWSTAYELAKLDPDILLAAIEAGRVHPKMERKDAIALRPPKPGDEAERESILEPPKPKKTGAEELKLLWDCATKSEHLAFLDAVGVEAILAAMSDAFGRELRDRVPKNNHDNSKKRKRTLNQSANPAQGFQH